ncbi:tight adherence pilus pseudopilin TadF [Pasteurellaceae bacterium LIM206]|nr:tight adherence pilus pseudopilin TadF [Pasteurellaceae bacterium LIM206]
MKETDSPIRRFFRFWRDKKGSVTVEFVFMLVLLALIFAFMADLVFIRSSLGKLDNASYSLVNVLRERQQLYDGNEALRQEDLSLFQQMASQILLGEKDQNLAIYLEELSFRGNTPYYSTLGAEICRPGTTLDRLENLSPRSEIRNERKIPIYQVTVCLNVGGGLFRALLVKDSAKIGTFLRSTSFAVAR